MGMNREELMGLLNPALQIYGSNRRFGPTYADQVRNANAGLGLLNDYAQDFKDAGIYDSLSGGLKSMKQNAYVGGGLSLLGGATQIATTANGLAQTQATPAFDASVDDLGRVGSYNYNNFGQIANDYAQTDFNPSVTEQEVRGLTRGQKWAGIGNAALAGASAGNMIGGPVGAAVGGALGAGIAGFATLSGDQAAKIDHQFKMNNAARAADAAYANLGAAHERIANRQNRDNTVRMVRRGGRIQRQSLIDYTNKVLGVVPRAERLRQMNIVHKKCSGGTMVRLKTK